MISAFLLFIIDQFTNIDLVVADYYYSPELKAFIWKNSWFANQVMHVYVKDPIIVFALLGLVLFWWMQFVLSALSMLGCVFGYVLLSFVHLLFLLLFLG